MSEAERWDSRYAGAAFFYGAQPNDWLVSMERHLPRRSAVLCLAEGEGRNAVFLAQRGHAVTAVDLSPVGVAKTLALAASLGVKVDARVGDLAELAIAPDSLDAVVSIWAHVPRPLQSMPSAPPSAPSTSGPEGHSLEEQSGPRYDLSHLQPYCWSRS